MKKLFYLLGISLVLIFGGCAMLQEVLQVKNPTIKFVNFNLDNITSNGVEGTVNLNISNPNGFSIPLTQIQTDVLLNNSPFTTLSNNESRNIGANSSENMGFKVMVPFSSIPNIIDVIKSSNDNIPLGFNSKLYFQQPVQITIPVNFNVNIPKPKLPKIQMSGIKIAKITFSNITINVNFTIDNPNPFRIAGTKISGKFNIEGNEIANIDQNISVEKNSKVNVPVSINVSTVSLGLTLINHLKQGNFSSSFNGTVKLPFAIYNIKL
ncbi:LEA type 2 family protein [bacterium]|nr:LEA type 2 family protein [bacterium]